MISKRTILIVLSVCILFGVFYQDYKKNQKLATPTLNNISKRAIDGTDPIRLHDRSSVQVASKIYEGLYEYHYLKRPLELIPNLAEEMPSISSDGLVYTFKIKQGVLFQNDACFPNGQGRELKASDFVFSFKRLLDPKNIVPYLSMIDGKIKGLDEWKVQRDYAQEAEGLKALDDYTLQITLTEPYPAFLHFLAQPVSFVVPKEAVIHYGDEFVNHPVGTGPFILEGGFNPQARQLVFVKNPNFRKKLFPGQGDPAYRSMIDAYAGEKLPLVHKVITDIIPEEGPRWLKMQNGEIDTQEIADTGFALELIGEDGQLLPQWTKKRLVLEQAPAATTEMFVYNHSHDLFKNTYLRQAMSMAFDRATYNQKFYKGAASIAQSLVPPVLMDVTNPLPAPYSYNIEGAKEYLAKAGFPDGKGLPLITLDVRSETCYKDKAEFFAQCMAKVGIQVQVVTSIWAELYNKVMKGGTMMHLYTWYGDYPDPANFFELIANKTLAGLYYENTKFNTLLCKANASTNHAEKQLLHLELNKIAAEEMPMLYAVHPPIQTLHFNWVKNTTCNDFCNDPDVYLAVDMEEKIKPMSWSGG